MRNCVVLGSGRSGTSLLAGTLAGAGYYMGDNMMAPTIGNPKGYFEAFDIQNINEDILAHNMFNRPEGWIGERFFKHIPLKNQRWLARIPVGKEMVCPPTVLARIKEKTPTVPYCFKDPRFCYTLPVWRDYLQDTVYFCIFRHPTFTAESILLEQQREKYLSTLKITHQHIYKLWKLMYSHVLEIHCQQGEWIFLHYNQIFEPGTLDRIEVAIGTKVDRSFPEKKLVKEWQAAPISTSVGKIYQQLCQRANFL